MKKILFFIFVVTVLASSYMLFSIFQTKTIHQALKRGNQEQLEKLLQDGANPNELDSYGNTPVGLAVAWGNTGGLKILLKNGANPNGTDYRGEPAIFIAASSNQFGVVNELIDAGADIWYANDFGATVGAMIMVTAGGGVEKDLAIEKMKKQGYPFPTPKPDDVLEMKKNGNWPPLLKQ